MLVGARSWAPVVLSYTAYATFTVSTTCVEPTEAFVSGGTKPPPWASLMPSKFNRLVVPTDGTAVVVSRTSGSGMLLICRTGLRSCSTMTLLVLCHGTGFISRNAKGVVVWAVSCTTVGFLCTCCAEAKNGVSRKRMVPSFLRAWSNFMWSP